MFCLLNVLHIKAGLISTLELQFILDREHSRLHFVNSWKLNRAQNRIIFQPKTNKRQVSFLDMLHEWFSLTEKKLYKRLTSTEVATIPLTYVLPNTLFELEQKVRFPSPTCPFTDKSLQMLVAIAEDLNRKILALLLSTVPLPRPTTERRMGAKRGIETIGNFLSLCCSCVTETELYMVSDNKKVVLDHITMPCRGFCETTVNKHTARSLASVVARYSSANSWDNNSINGIAHWRLSEWRQGQSIPW